MSAEPEESSRLTAVVFTTEEEAQPFLARYRCGVLDGIGEGETATDGRIAVSITGPGKIKATLRTERLMRMVEPNRLLHVGSCEALKPAIQPGMMIAASQVLEGDRMEVPAPNYPRMPLDPPVAGLRSATLVTQDHPFSDAEQARWFKIADVSDGSGYAVAFVAATHGVPCHIVKVVTGEATPLSKNTAPGAGEQLADFLMKCVG